MWLVKPSPDFVTLALGLVVLGTIATEFAHVFYNALLPTLVPQQRLGPISGLGWGTGYVGGTVCLGLALILFIPPDVPTFGLQTAAAAQCPLEGARVGLCVAG